jgi:hypothetical protein
VRVNKDMVIGLCMLAGAFLVIEILVTALEAMARHY